MGAATGDRGKQANRQPRVVIVGAGFGGLRVASKLAGKPIDVLLVDRHNYHTFLPLLYQVATAGLEPEQIVYPVRAIVQRAENVRFQMARVDDVDLSGQRLITTVGDIPYDYLVLAAGSTTNFFGQTTIEKQSFGLKDMREAESLRNHLLTMFERALMEEDAARRQAMLTFVIVGGGPTGVELAGAVSELINHVLVRDYPGLDFSEVRVILLEALDQLLLAFPPKLQANAMATLRAKGVDVRLGATVAEATPEAVRLKDGTVIPTWTLVWAAGVRAVDLAATLEKPTAKGGRVEVEPTLQLAQTPNVFVIGDMAYFEVRGKPLPMVAPVAMQQGEHAADNIERMVRGQRTKPFQYRDKGSLATIGRNAAVAHIGPLQFTGFVAWVVWLGVHIIQLIGFRNRVLVLINWAWSYLFYDRAVRLITDDAWGSAQTNAGAAEGEGSARTTHAPRALAQEQSAQTAEPS